LRAAPDPPAAEGACKAAERIAVAKATKRTGWRPLSFAAALAGLICLGAARPPSPVAVSYTVSPEIHHGRLTALDVSVRFRAGPDGRAAVHLPDSESGSAELWRNIRDFRVEGARSVSEPGPAERRITAGPGAPLTVRYRLVSAFDHDPDVGELDTYKPLIRPTRFWVYGEAAFINVDGPRQAVFRWTGAPAGFGFASDLENARGGTMPLHDLMESVMVGGPDLNIYRRKLPGAQLRVASLGAFDFPSEEFADLTARIVRGERAFWGAHDGDFLVALAPLGPDGAHISVRGEGRGDAFAIQGGSTTPLAILKLMLTHEYFHTWNPARLGGMYEGKREPAAYWFSEGFTDFYAHKLALRIGVLDLKGFVDAWNRMLRSYARSPVRTAPNDRVVADFWNDSAVQELPYQRGAMLAATWDRALRARSGGGTGLDDVMLAMSTTAGENPGGPKAPDLFVATVRRFGLDVAAEVARFVERGEPITLPADAFGGCLSVVTRREPSFEQGFELDKTGGRMVVAKVVEGSAAYAAGLRQGMVVAGGDTGRYGDPTIPSRLRVIDNGAERVIQWLPAGKGELVLQQVEMPSGLTPAQEAACARTVALAR
jgi:predicted metalloprotease with PDZ domain